MIMLLPRLKFELSDFIENVFDPTLCAVIEVPGIFAIRPTTSASYFYPRMIIIVSLLSSVSKEFGPLIPSATKIGILGIGLRSFSS